MYFFLSWSYPRNRNKTICLCNFHWPSLSCSVTNGLLVYTHLHLLSNFVLIIVTTSFNLKLQIQVIIPSTWIFAFTLNFPVFLVKDIGKEKTGNLCVSIWPADWMQRAYSLSWKVVVFLSCAVMAGLYSRVVYMLWFKRHDDNGLEHRQKVNIKLRIHAPGEEFFCLFSLGFFFMSGTTNQNKGTDFVQMLCLPSPTCRSVFVLMRE